MSFSLPRSNRGLSFTGNFRAPGSAKQPPAAKIITPTPGVGLGKARPKQTPVSTPSPLSGRLPDRIEIREIEPMAPVASARTMRRQELDQQLDDEMPTSSFQHDALDFLSPPPKMAPPTSAQPVFSVKKAVQPDSPSTVLVPGRKKKNAAADKAGARSGRILMFVMIGLLSMMVGYRFVPMMLERFDPPASEQ